MMRPEIRKYAIIGLVLVYFSQRRILSGRDRGQDVHSGYGWNRDKLSARMGMLS